MNRIRIASKISLLLLLPAACVTAQPASFSDTRPSAIESLKSSVPPSFFDELFPLPCAAHGYPPGLAGERLFQELHKAATPTGTNYAAYKQAKAYMYSKADNLNCGGAPGILTFYSQVCANGSSGNGDDYREKGDQNGDGVSDDFINAEHLWPQSFYKSAMPMFADLHHLAPTFPTPNSRRGNLRYAKVADPVYATSSGSKLGKEGFEPADAVKGNVARSMLYFITRYHNHNIRQGMDYDDFWTSRVDLFLTWNRQDPPDAAERRRNDLVEAFQGNRNPYIDDPELADKVGAAVFKSH